MWVYTTAQGAAAPLPQHYTPYTLLLPLHRTEECVRRIFGGDFGLTLLAHTVYKCRHDPSGALIHINMRGALIAKRLIAQFTVMLTF